MNSREPAEGGPSISLSVIAEALRGFAEIQPVSESAWVVHVNHGSILRLRAVGGVETSSDDASQKIECIEIETPAPVKVADARALFPLAFAIAARLDWRVFEAEALGDFLDPARLNHWVREFTGYREAPEPTAFDMRVAQVLDLKLPAIIVAAALGFGATAAGLVYFDVREPWLGWLIPGIGIPALCGALASIAACKSLWRRVRPPAVRRPN